MLRGKGQITASNQAQQTAGGKSVSDTLLQHESRSAGSITKKTSRLRTLGMRMRSAVTCTASQITWQAMSASQHPILFAAWRAQCCAGVAPCNLEEWIICTYLLMAVGTSLLHRTLPAQQQAASSTYTVRTQEHKTQRTGLVEQAASACAQAPAPLGGPTHQSQSLCNL